MRKRQSPASRDGMLETVFFVYSFQEEWLQCHRIDQERSIRDDKKKLEQAKKRLSDLDVIISRLYEDYVLGNLSQDRYKKMAADYEAEQERLKLEIEVIEEWVEQREEMNDGLDAFIALTQKYVDVEELAQTIVNEYAIKSEFGIEGDIIPMSCIVNNGDQDPSILINGFGEGYGDADKDRHIAVTDDLKVICAATQQGYREGLDWLHKLYSENLIDPECFTQEWSTYVSKGKAGRYGVCFSWDVANIDNLTDWEPLPALTADTRNITPQNGSFTSGFGRGKCVVTAKASNPALVCAWLDQMYAPLQSPQNNWGTYGDETGFNIFEMSTNDKGEPMLKHAPPRRCVPR